MAQIIRSQIHEALGTKEPLTYATIEQAVEAHVRESDALDWKAALHDDAAEFAKDIVALANLRGGLLVIGVAEVKAEASNVVGVEFTDATERRLRGWLTNHVQPTLRDVSFTFLQGHEAGSRGVLVVSVPPSANAPHLVTAQAGQASKTAWPRRNGTHTEWMGEYDIERAYRDRFARRVTDEEALAAMVANAIDLFDQGITPWLIVAARPITPAATSTGAPSSEQITTAVAEAIDQSARIRPRGSRYSNSVMQGVAQVQNAPVVGLRRWVMHSHATSEPDALSDWGHIEIHHDGSLLIAAPFGRWGTPTRRKSALQDWALGAVVADAVCLIDQVSVLRNIETGYVVRLEPWRVRSDLPYALTSAWVYGSQHQHEAQVHRTLDVRRFAPILTELPAMGSNTSRQIAAWNLLRDAIAQFGAAPETIGWPGPSGSD